MVRQFLAAAPEEGLARLALGRSDGLYAGLLAPRLETLRRAVRAGETAHFALCRAIAQGS